MSSVARRYAKALFALAREQNQIESVGREINAAAIELSLPEVEELATSPRLPAERRHALVNAVAQQLSLAPLTVTFLSLLADKHRLREVSAIASRFQEMEDEALGRVRMNISTATPLFDGERDEIAATFGRQLQRTVLARTNVDPTLLGGIVVEVEGKVFDGSVRSNLERLASRMAHSDSQ